MLGSEEIEGSGCLKLTQNTSRIGFEMSIFAGTGPLVGQNLLFFVSSRVLASITQVDAGLSTLSKKSKSGW